jgi:hypothetical protein
MREFSSSSHVGSTRVGQRAAMSSWVKALIVMALVVPMTAYVAGSLVSSNARAPADRSPVIIDDRSAPAPVTPSGSTEPRDPTQPVPPDDGGVSIDDNEARVVTPQPTAVDDSDDDEEDDDRREGDDDGSRTGDDTDDGDD